MKPLKKEKRSKNIKKKRCTKKEWVLSYEVFMEWKEQWHTFTSKYCSEKDAEKAKEVLLKGGGLWSGLLEGEFRNLKIYRK